MVPEALIAVKAAKELDKSIDELIAIAKKGLKDHFLKWKTKSEIEKLKENIRQVGKICTIASRQASTVGEIYYPSKLKYSNSSRTIVSSEELFPNNTRMALIQGTAGQGKSVFLRFLCIQDLDYAGKIPIFIELRKIDKDVDIVVLIKNQLKILGLEDSLVDIAFTTMLHSGSVRLYLDGLDEIKREYVLTTKENINTLLNKHQKLQIALTSRPGALRQHFADLPYMQQYEISPLTERDYAGFFAKIGTAPETTERLIRSIEKSNAQIKNLLSTPLMLTLLVLTCGQKQDLPDTLPEFYDSLFNLLSSMHDGTKPGFTRQKATNLSNPELETLFRAFSYVSKELIGKVSLTHNQFESTLAAALKITDLKCTSEGFRTDITETICLMVKDGVDTTFTHKSIQEYYTASFIHRIEDGEISKQVFQSLEDENIYSWINELRFLEDFQNLYYEKTIGIPHAVALTERLYLSGKKKPTISRSTAQKLFSDMGIKVARMKISKATHGMYWALSNGHKMNRYLPDLSSAISNDFRTHLRKSATTPVIGDQLEFVSLRTILKEDPLAANRIYGLIQKFCDGLLLKVKSMQERQIRQRNGLIDILANKRPGRIAG
jgi:hypothetical protein